MRLERQKQRVEKRFVQEGGMEEERETMLTIVYNIVPISETNTVSLDGLSHSPEQHSKFMLELSLNSESTRLLSLPSQI